MLSHAIKPATVADCAREVLEVIPAVMRPLRNTMRSYRGAGLSVPQFRALCFVERYDGASLSQVAEHLDLALPTVSRMVNGLVERGFMQRRSSESDRRNMSLSVRAPGRAVMQQTRSATQAFLVDQFQHLSTEQRDAMIVALGALRDVFEQDMPHRAEEVEVEAQGESTAPV
jgi:DNA-binding MarR family transcriptional regulator